MTDYLVILDSETNPNAPLRSSLFKRMVANPIAIAEGAPNAPRIDPKALRAPAVNLISLTSTNWGAFTGLDRIKCIQVDWGLESGSSTATFQVSFSSDGGVSWGSTQNLAALAILPSGSGCLLTSRIDIKTGDAVWLIGDLAKAHSGTVTLTVPPGCNAVRFRSSIARSSGVMLTPLGGIDA